MSGTLKKSYETAPDDINFSILLRVSTGKTGFMTTSNDYRFTVEKSLSINSSGFTPVNVSVHVS
ncbi:hypothetical protein J2128_000318 [Methanomicrobium sp. W14]|uniref:hypothetical protein n=1 Tax=Methanomicrobium sp. W14 TaxID=2817839 RepID=UPI001AE6967E|nr:hypothetical protein [Methanomicrobium sp. W14]MBP2132397.1 hypothetical protein [Methanomicrobium sp. W14]